MTYPYLRRPDIARNVNYDAIVGGGDERGEWSGERVGERKSVCVARDANIRNCIRLGEIPVAVSRVRGGRGGTDKRTAAGYEQLG